MTRANLKRSLIFLKVPELRELCRKKLRVADKGNKTELVSRIISAMSPSAGNSSGPQRLNSKHNAGKFPDSVTLAYWKEHGDGGGTGPGAVDNKILHGEWKLNHHHRNYINALLAERGLEKHFVVPGMDWIKSKWRLGEIPSFGEYIDHQEELAALKAKGVDTFALEKRQNLQYMNFVRKEQRERARKGASKSWKGISYKWKIEREKQKKLAIEEIEKWIDDKKGSDE